ncbi:MAG: cyclic nucleotide-binding domain-containing protein [Coraliomargaritaceae bacterium]
MVSSFLSLRPIPLFFAIIFSALGGVLIEYLQLLSNRDCDVMDMIANALGLLVGCSIGVTARLCWNAVSREFSQAFSSKKLLVYQKGETLLREDQKVEHLMIIKSGRVEVSRSDWNQTFEYGKGGIIGMMAAVKGDGQYTTIQAQEKTVVFKVPIEKLHQDVARRETPVAMVLDGMADAFMEMAQRIEVAKKGERPEPPAESTISQRFEGITDA